MENCSEVSGSDSSCGLCAWCAFALGEETERRGTPLDSQHTDTTTGVGVLGVQIA